MENMDNKTVIILINNESKYCNRINKYVSAVENWLSQSHSVV